MWNMADVEGQRVVMLQPGGLVDQHGERRRYAPRLGATQEDVTQRLDTGGGEFAAQRAAQQLALARR